MDNIRYSLLKSGDKFCAIIKGEIVKGKIQKEGNLYLCQNKIAGKSITNKLGYKYSWYVPVYKDIPYFKNEGVTNFVIINSSLTSIFSHNINRRKGKTHLKNKFIFGCGAVKVTKEEMLNYLKIKLILKRRNIDLIQAEETMLRLISE